MYDTSTNGRVTEEGAILRGGSRIQSEIVGHFQALKRWSLVGGLVGRVFVLEFRRVQGKDLLQGLVGGGEE